MQSKKQPEKMDKIKEVKSEFVHENQVTGNTNSLDKPTGYQTQEPQSGDDIINDYGLSKSNSSDKGLTGNENSLVVDPLKIQPPLVQQDGLIQTDQQPKNDEN